jgi:hypothetical protein
MKLKTTGYVLFANGEPAPGVEVRVFDRDAESKHDDDLTVTAGVSDNRGRFTVVYEPLRYLDMGGSREGDTPSQPFNIVGARLPDLTDVYLPYLHFMYTFRDQPRRHNASLVPFQDEFRLPETQPVDFLPSRNGLPFVNSFSGYFLPFSIPNFGGPKKVPQTYGLCGGMCSAAYDYALKKRTVPPGNKIPKQGSRMQRYLYRRQIDSFGALGQMIVKVAQWTTLPDDTALGVQRRTAEEWSQIRPRLSDGSLVILALVYEKAHDLKQLARVIFNNHQVLAYGYRETAEDSFEIKVYDPNFPRRDDVVLRMQRVMLEVGENAMALEGLSGNQYIGEKLHKPVRGFFDMPYVPVTPPGSL